MIDWNDYPKSTHANVAFFDDYGKSVGLKHLRRPTQPKTVADAVEYLNDTMQGRWFSDCKYLCYREDNHWFYSDKSSDDVVCTREQFEAYVKEQDGEKWTHIVNYGFSEQEECRIISENGDFVWVQVNGAGRPATYKKSELKLIKPTMTEEQQKMVAKFVARIYAIETSYNIRDEFDKFCNEHDII